MRVLKKESSMFLKVLIFIGILMSCGRTEGVPVSYKSCYVIHDSNLNCYVYAGSYHDGLANSAMTAHINCTGKFSFQIIINRQSGGLGKLHEPKGGKRSCGKLDCLPNENFDKLCSYASKVTTVKENRTAGGQLLGTPGGTSGPTNLKTNDYTIPMATGIPSGVVLIVIASLVGLFVYGKVKNGHNNAPANTEGPPSSAEHINGSRDDIPPGNESSEHDRPEGLDGFFSGHEFDYEEPGQLKILLSEESRSSRQGDGEESRQTSIL